MGVPRALEVYFGKLRVLNGRGVECGSVEFFSGEGYFGGHCRYFEESKVLRVFEGRGVDRGGSIIALVGTSPSTSHICSQCTQQ